MPMMDENQHGHQQPTRTTMTSRELMRITVYDKAVYALYVNVIARTYYIKMYISAEKMQRTELIDCQGLLVVRNIPSRICES